MLAAKKPVFEKIEFPVLATPKIDGIRCVKVNGKALSRSFKPIPNVHIRGLIETLPDGLDGELVAGSNFNEVQSGIMTHAGAPDFKYLVFDYVSKSLIEPYAARVMNLRALSLPSFVEVLYPEVANNLEELQVIIDKHLAQGFEGTMIRSPGSPYKCGRSTLKEGYLTAIKHFVDAEAELIGFEELFHNENEQELNELGYKDRSSHKSNMVPGNTLGAFIVKSEDGTVFKIGTGVGLTQAFRKEIWDNQSKFLGKLVHYRYQPHGVKDRPRVPSFYGFRSREDMS
jgi:DNA ligase-1